MLSAQQLTKLLCTLYAHILPLKQFMLQKFCHTTLEEHHYQYALLKLHPLHHLHAQGC